MRPADTALSHVSVTSSKRRGFSLIEAAIVLGVVGIVIGGIWYAANTVQSSMRVSDLTKSVIQTAEATKRILQRGNYPFWNNGFIGGIGRMAVAAEIAPKDYSFNNSSEVFTSPYNAAFSMATVCFGNYGGSTCPALNVYISIKNSGASAGLTTAECTQMLRRLGSLLKDNGMIGRIQLGSPTTFFDPPFNASTAQCASTTTVMQIFFKP